MNLGDTNTTDHSDGTIFSLWLRGLVPIIWLNKLPMSLLKSLLKHSSTRMNAMKELLFVEPVVK
eukprot:3694630-Ditylum_brightwellii.AAC.1